MNVENLSRIQIIVILIFLTSAVYFNSLRNEFVWDDNEIIIGSDYFKNTRFIPAYLTSDFCKGFSGVNCNFYRPVISIIHLLEYKIWGLNPFGYHFTSVFFHAIAVILIFKTSLILLNDTVSSLISALIFAVHPVHVESMTMAVNITDAPTTMFLLTSFITYDKYIRGNRYLHLFLSLASFILALLSKEMAATLPIILLIYMFLKFPKNIFRKALNLTSYFLVLAGYIIIRKIFLTGGGLDLKLNALYARLLNIPYLVTGYLKLLLFPINLTPMRTSPAATGLFEFNVIFPFLLLIIIFVFMRWLYKYSKSLFFSLSWFFVTLLPVLNIIPVPIPAVTDRYVYIPSIGFSIFMGGVISDSFRSHKIRGNIKNVLILFLLFIIFFYFIATVKRNAVWRDDITLWKDTATKSPFMVRPHLNLGFGYYKRKETTLAIQEFKKTLTINPNFVDGHYNLGFAYEDQGDIDLAIKEYQESIKLDANHYRSHNNLGMIYKKNERIDEAIKEFQTAIKISPDTIDAHMNLGYAYGLLGKFDQAINEFKIASKIDPYNSRIPFDLEITETLRLNPFIEKAKEDFKKLYGR